MNFILRAIQLSSIFHFFWNEFRESRKYGDSTIRFCLPVFYDDKKEELEIIVDEKYRLLEMSRY